MFREANTFPRWKVDTDIVILFFLFSVQCRKQVKPSLKWHDALWVKGVILVQQRLWKVRRSTSSTHAQDGVTKYKAVSNATTIPDEILNDAKLIQAMSVLPSNYNFEIQKTVWRLKSKAAKRAGLQFPEGLLAYSCIISDILEQYVNQYVYVVLTSGLPV